MPVRPAQRRGLQVRTADLRPRPVEGRLRRGAVQPHGDARLAQHLHREAVHPGEAHPVRRRRGQAPVEGGQHPRQRPHVRQEQEVPRLLAGQVRGTVQCDDRLAAACRTADATGTAVTTAHHRQLRGVQVHHPRFRRQPGRALQLGQVELLHLDQLGLLHRPRLRPRARDRHGGPDVDRVRRNAGVQDLRPSPDVLRLEPTAERPQPPEQFGLVEDDHAARGRHPHRLADEHHRAGDGQRSEVAVRDHLLHRGHLVGDVVEVLGHVELVDAQPPGRQRHAPAPVLAVEHDNATRPDQHVVQIGSPSAGPASTVHRDPALGRERLEQAADDGLAVVAAVGAGGSPTGVGSLLLVRSRQGAEPVTLRPRHHAFRMTQFTA